MERFQGEYDPPLEIHDMRVPRLVGPGWLSFGAEGLAIGGTFVDRPPPFNTRPVGVAIIAIGTLAAVLLGRWDQLMPIAIFGGLAVFGLSFWLEREVPLLQTLIPWPKVERVIQYPKDPDRLAILLDVGKDLPSTVYFTPLEGPAPVLDAMRAARPELEIDTESARLAAEDAAKALAYDPDENIYTPDPLTDES